MDKRNRSEEHIKNETVTTDKRTCHFGSRWLIVASGFICIFVVDGMLYSYGILLVNLVEVFQSSRAMTELVAAIQFGVFGIAGPLSARLIEAYGVPVAVIAGSLLNTVGLICSAFVTQLYMLFVTYSVLVGLGISLMYNTSCIAVISTFDDKKTLANGMAYCGTDQATTLNIPKHNTTWLLTALGIANIISRVVFGFLGDRAGVSRLLILSIISFLAGICTVLSVLLDNFAGKMVYSCLFGFINGGYFTLTGVVVGDLVGFDKLPLAYGTHTIAICAGLSFGGPLGGLMFDKTGSYMPTFVFAGGMMILGGVIGFIIEKGMKRKTLSSNDSVMQQEIPVNFSVYM